MLRLLSLIILSCISFSAQGSLRVILAELSSTTQEKIWNKQQEVSALEYDIQLGSLYWQLYSSLSYNDTFGVGFFNFQTQRSINQNFALALRKPFIWGGEFSYQAGITRHDLSKWTPSLRASLTQGLHPYQWESGFSYSQDLGRNLFGQRVKAQLKIAALKAKVQSSSSQLSQDVQKQLVCLAYIQAKAYKHQINVLERLINQGKKRVETFRRRYQEGTVLKDSYLASQNTLASFEMQKQEAKLKLSQSLREMGQELEKTIEESQVQVFETDHLIEVPQLFLDDLREIQSLRDQLEILKKEVEIQNIQLRPDVKLTASYQSASLESRFSKSFSEGFVGSPYNDKVLKLEISVPLGSKALKAARSKYKAQAYLSELEIEKKQAELKSWLQGYREELSFYRANIKKLNDRKKILTQMLLEREHLFRDGRKSIDELIETQEQLAQVESQFIQARMSYDLYALKTMSQFGQLDLFIKEYQE